VRVGHSYFGMDRVGYFAARAPMVLLPTQISAAAQPLPDKALVPVITAFEINECRCTLHKILPSGRGSVVDDVGNCGRCIGVHMVSTHITSISIGDPMVRSDARLILPPKNSAIRWLVQDPALVAMGQL